jgi:hypothetical protein
MKQVQEIPCGTCQSWNKKYKKFSCNPKKCKDLSAWLLEHIPQLSFEPALTQIQLPETATQYVV